jgi:hypothetical protein
MEEEGGILLVLVCWELVSVNLVSWLRL